MDYKKIMLQIVSEKKSIRDMARELGIPKTTLHRKLTQIKCDEFTYLMIHNKKTMLEKRWAKKKLEK